MTVQRSGLLLLLCATLAACSENQGTPSTVTETPAAVGADAPVVPATFSYRVEMTNLTVGQPLSPLAVIAHGTVYSAFDIGAAASPGLEQLAEGGDNAAFLAEAAAQSDVVFSGSGSGVIAPGESDVVTLELSGPQTVDVRVSALTMLVNTNDAITGLRNIEIESLAVGASRSINTIGYDSGTEANSEAAGTIPGPADGGEGFNAVRDDISDAVRGHGGVVTQADGLATSVLGEQHRWDNPIARVTITRVR